MKKYCHRLFAFFLLFGLFSFSEGKPCPERTRPHKTRCDVYFKCTELTADNHAWVPTRCEEGLIYEHSLTVCVLPADDWGCLMGDHKTNTKSNSNSNADIYTVANAEDEDNSLNSKFDDAKMEIVIGPDISDEDTDERDEAELYDGSGNGSESVELDGFMPAQNREAEVDDMSVIKKKEEVNTDIKYTEEIQKKEQNLEEILQTIKTKAEIGQPSTNVDPKLTAHLQRLSQLINGLKQTYQTPETKPEDVSSLRPDQLNAFLAHFNIKNKFDSLDPSESYVEGSGGITSKSNRTLHYNHEINEKLKPETKVVLSHTLPHRYGGSNYDNSNSAGGYTSSQIVVNRPEGSVLFSLPEHHYMEYSLDNTPTISEDTLKTVLELSKQMIAQQNVPKVISSSTYYAPPIMQPILLTPHIDSPFSTNYIGQNSNSLGHPGQYNNEAYKPNYEHRKPGKRPQHSGGNNGYSGNGGDHYENSNNNDYNNYKPGTTVIHNNVIPVPVSTTSSAEKDVLDSYGQSLSLYPPLYGERPESDSDYHGNSNSNNRYPLDLLSSELTSSGSGTKNPAYGSLPTISNPYVTTPKPFEFQSTTSNIEQYFTPSEHLGNHNINNVFSSVNSYGSIPRPMKGKKPNLQNHKPHQENTNEENSYGFTNQLFPQINSHRVHVSPNSQNLENIENENGEILNGYQEDNKEDDAQLITYTYGNKQKPGQQTQFSNYDDSGSPISLNTVFSNKNPYIPRPQSISNTISSSSSYYSSGKNKYTPSSSPISSAFGEGTQLVNVGGNYMSLDVFQNSILPLMGNNAAAFSSSLNNIEVITCAAGVRQPNNTDCTRYYVCSQKDGKVLSYSCPPYTGFNSHARICDAKTYAMCSGDSILPSYSVSENKRIQMETLKALEEAKRRQMLQQQAIKSQNTANFPQLYKPTSSSPFHNPFTSLTSPDQHSTEQNMLNSYMQQAASMSPSFATTPRPQVTMPTVKKRKYYCKEGDKIADQTSVYNYFVCYKNANGQMKGHKMTCSKGLLFCPKTTMCTLPSKCL